MFSALRFVVASVILALFGGFLLAGILATQQGDEMMPAAPASPTSEATSGPTEADTTSVRTDILPDVELTVEEVEPGVYRVISDGVRDLVLGANTGLATGRDEGVWLLRKNQFLRLGSDDTDKWPVKGLELADFEVAPDGTVWTAAPRGGDTTSIQSFDGEEWTTHHTAAGWGATVEVTSDGTVWAFWEDPQQPSGESNVFGYLDDDGWQILGQLENIRTLLVASPDDIWATGGGGWFEAPHVVRFVDGAWQRLVGLDGTEATWQPAEDDVATDAESLGWGEGLGSDGTLWVVDGDGALVRFDGSGWSRWPPSDTGVTPVPFEPLGVAPDGSVWFATVTPPDDFCEGVGHFDGVTPGLYLPGHCIKAIDITTDGSVWLLAAEEEGRETLDLYVITPEAVAATA